MYHALMEVTIKQLGKYKDWLLRYGRSKTTADQYANHVRRAYEEGGAFERLTDTNLSPNYLQLSKAALKAWALFLGDEELVADLAKVKLPPALRQKEGVPLTKPEWSALRAEIDSADYIKEPMRAELGMLVCRGFRCGDVLRIKRAEVIGALKGKVLDYEGKGRKRLRFTVGPSWRKYLEIFAGFKDWERVEDLICPRSKPDNRTKSSGKAVDRALEKCSIGAGLGQDKVHPHLLRHTYATHYYAQCLDPAKLQAHMQWADIKVAMGYVNAGTREELDAIADSLFE